MVCFARRRRRRRRTLTLRCFRVRAIRAQTNKNKLNFFSHSRFIVLKKNIFT